MKIALVTSSAPFGKGESFVVEEANALVDAGAQVLVVPTVIRSGALNRPALRQKIQLIAQRLLSIEVLKCSCIIVARSPVAVLRALWAITSSHPLTLAKNVAVFPKALWLAFLVQERRVEHIHAHWVSTPSTVAMAASMVSGVPWSCTAHRGDIVANNLLDRKVHCAAFTRFISKSGIALARERSCFAGVKARLLHMGVSIPAHPAKMVPRESAVVMCPANMIEIKGHRFLIEAWARLSTRRPVKLLLAGDGELRDDLEVLANELGLGPAVEFLGHVSHVSLLAMYSRGEVDMVVLPSLDLGGGLHEGIPVCLMEAMAFGIPVVSTATGGIPELLGGGAGVMVPQADSLRLAKEIAGLLDDNDLAREQGERGRSRVLDQFDNRAIVETLLTWFGEQQEQLR